MILGWSRAMISQSCLCHWKVVRPALQILALDIWFACFESHPEWGAIYDHDVNGTNAFSHWSTISIWWAQLTQVLAEVYLPLYCTIVWFQTAVCSVWPALQTKCKSKLVSSTPINCNEWLPKWLLCKVGPISTLKCDYHEFKVCLLMCSACTACTSVTRMQGIYKLLLKVLSCNT